MRISQENFLTAFNNKKLIRGALKYAHVYPSSNNYEDYFQEGVLVYAHLLEIYKNKERSEIDKLAFNKIVWKITDELRKLMRNKERSVDFDDAMEVADKISWDNLVWLEFEVEKMTELEKTIFFEHLIGRRTITALATECNVTRKHLQTIKRKLLTRLAQAMK